MLSHEVLKQAADRVGVKALAAELKLSAALVYKWCQESDLTDPDASGTRNPLDRVADIVRVTGDDGPVRWLCEQGNGFLVANPPASQTRLGAELIANTQRLVREFSELLTTVTASIADDGRIEPDEAERIRRTWELFKSTVETFTVACERGVFATSAAPGKR